MKRELSPRARNALGVLILTVILAAVAVGLWYDMRESFTPDPLAAFNVWQSRVDSFVAREQRTVQRLAEAEAARKADPDMTTEFLREIRRAKRQFEADQRRILDDRYPELQFGAYDQRLRGALERLSAAAAHRLAAMGALLWVVERGQSSYVKVFNSEWLGAQADEAAALACMAEMRKVLEAYERSGGR